ncbi:hypothetical protein BDZ91DRAFT_800908 [Kalaharituber pfeilii]|nr:hypothetical protein BDZ91DRAFT_800908 [Kalaharituber pfeilii]
MISSIRKYWPSPLILCFYKKYHVTPLAAVRHGSPPGPEPSRLRAGASTTEDTDLYNLLGPRLTSRDRGLFLTTRRATRKRTTPGEPLRPNGLEGSARTRGTTTAVTEYRKIDFSTKPSPHSGQPGKTTADGLDPDALPHPTHYTPHTPPDNDHTTTAHGQDYDARAGLWYTAT